MPYRYRDSPQEMQAAIHEEIERLKTQDVSDEELQMVKTRARASLVRGLASNHGLAQQLAAAQARYGDWRELFRQVDRIEKVGQQDIRRVASKTFVESNRDVGIMESTRPAAAPPRREAMIRSKLPKGSPASAVVALVGVKPGLSARKASAPRKLDADASAVLGCRGCGSTGWDRGRRGQR